MGGIPLSGRGHSGGVGAPDGGFFLWWREMWKACVYGLLVREGGRGEKEQGGIDLPVPYGSLNS